MSLNKKRTIAMELFLNILIGALQLASAVCSIIILVYAFQTSVGQGFLCLCIPFYIIYFALVEFNHEKKELILGLWIGPTVLAIVLIMFAGG
jgi:hypothetical protein